MEEINIYIGDTDKNPIPELIDNETFLLLNKEDLFNQSGLRDYTLKREFKKLRESGMRSDPAIEKLNKFVPNVQFETVRKLVYKGIKR